MKYYWHLLKSQIVNYLVNNKAHILELTSSGETKLSTHNYSIFSTPKVITDCSPLIVVAEFHSSLSCNSSTNKPECALGAGCYRCKSFTSRSTCMCSNYTLALVVLHLTPASSECWQLWDPSALAGQSMSLVSEPVQATLSSQICPDPWPNPALDTAVAPVQI